MSLKWFSLVVIFALCFLGLEIYHNIALMDRGYLRQELESKKSRLIKENGYLQEKLSPVLSLNRVEDYAREKLGLVDPKKVRFLKENFSPPTQSSSPPPLKVKTGMRSWTLQIISQFGRWFNMFHEEKKYEKD